jgi:hypothetical protein
VQGHNIATKGENHFVAMKYGIPAAKYQMALKPGIADALKHGAGAGDIPADLDQKPYQNMGETHLLGQHQHDLEPLRKEIGWDQMGGRLLREPEADGQGGHAPVSGRTTWVGKAGPNGESDFWRMRPAEGGKITEKQAHEALTKHAAGEPLTAREKRFIDYSQKTAQQYDDDYHAELERYQQDQRDMNAASRAEALQELRESSVPPADFTEMLTINQLADRAYEAGADPRQVLDAVFDGTPAEIARKLWNITHELERSNAHSQDDSRVGQAADGQADEGISRAGADEPQAVYQAAAAEQGRRVPAEADQVDEFGRPSLPSPTTMKVGGSTYRITQAYHWVVPRNKTIDEISDHKAVAYNVQKLHVIHGGGFSDEIWKDVADSKLPKSVAARASEEQKNAQAIAHGKDHSSQVPRGDLFAPATVNDRIRAANEAKDDARNGMKGGRTDTGDGGLFDGKRPEQVSLDSVESDVTDTPAFRKWFGDSEAVDAAGKPLMVYHATRADFDTFTQQPGSDLGFHFGSREQASGRGETRQTDSTAVMPVYLSIKHPLRVNDPGYFGVEHAATGDDVFFRELRGAGVDVRPGMSHREAIGALERAGYDGLVYSNDGEGGGDSWVAFRPEQIKSATGNRGTFDPNKPSILDQVDTGTEVTHHSLDDNTPEARAAKQAIERYRQSRDSRDASIALDEQARQESRDQGERDSTSRGLRDVVSKTLGGLGGNLKVEFLRDETGMPEGSNLRPLPNGRRRLGTFNPHTNRVSLFTGSNPSPANMAFTAAHEVYGHRAMRMLADAHPDVKVGSMTASEALNKALDMAMQNPTVAKIAESMGRQRNTDDVHLMAEEALADLSAAKQTGNWDKIKTKHGVDVPEGVRNGVRGAIANFIERMKRILNAIIAKITRKPANFTDAQVHEFMQDSANALHGEEAPSKASDHAEPSKDAVDHEAVKSDGLSLTKVKSLLVERGIPEETVNAMSRDQLRAEQAQLRARSEPTSEIKDTGVKNATKEEERAMKGKAEVEHDLSTTNPAQYATAKARFDADPYAGQLLAAKVISDKKAITPEDSILLGLDAMRIINARQVAYEQAEKAMASGDHATRVAALSLVRQLDGQMESNDIASRYSGVRAGQALQARKVMIAQDYSMARMVLRAKVAKGADLTDAERTKVEKAASDIAQRTKELDAREAKLRAMEAEARPVAQKRAAKAKFDDLAAQLKEIAQKDQMKAGCVS